MGLRVLVCGSRYYTDYRKVLEEIRKLDVGLVIAGACRGADSLAVKAARACGIPYVEFPADWQTFGKAAGPIRNAKMLKEGKPDFVLVFHPDVENSKGTKHMLSLVKKAGIPFLEVCRQFLAIILVSINCIKTCKRSQENRFRQNFCMQNFLIRKGEGVLVSNIFSHGCYLKTVLGK